MVVDVYNLKKEKVGQIELTEGVFGAPVKEHLMHEVVRAQRASRRSGSASAKERNAVAGGGRKPYRQKGTGRARQGSRRAPNWAGGGKAHGPRPRSYAFRPPAKVRRAALVSALSLRHEQNKLLVVEDLELDKISTGTLQGILETLEVSNGLLVDGRANEKLRFSARNLESHDFIPPEGVNVYDVLRHGSLVLTKDAAEALGARLDGGAGGGS